MSLITFACSLEFITLIRFFYLCVYPRFKRRQLDLIGSDMSLEDAAAVHLNSVRISRQHQVNFRLDALVAEDVRVDGFCASKRNNILVASERDCPRRADRRPHPLNAL